MVGGEGGNEWMEVIPQPGVSLIHCVSGGVGGGGKATNPVVTSSGSFVNQAEKRTDLDPEHLASVRQSYKMMMREFLQDINLYEAKQAKRNLLEPA